MLIHEPLLLASKSTIRRVLLENAGLKIEVEPAQADEDKAKRAFQTERVNSQPADLAKFLAQMKATLVSGKHPRKLTIGADQILVFEDKIISKPTSIDEARNLLIEMRAKSHELVSAVALAMDGKVLWSFDEAVQVKMRDFSDEFLSTYLAAAGDSVLETVGGYKLEGLGVHLFEKIDGDYFTVLGLPMIPLLEFLRLRNRDLV